MARTVVIAAAVAQRAGVGGHTWVILQYMLGFRRLGWNVYLFDALAPGDCTDAAGKPCDCRQSHQVAYLVQVMERFGFTGNFALMVGEDTIGIGRETARDVLRQAALLVNVNGYLRDEALLQLARYRVYLDIDPGFGQMWQELGLFRPFHGHDAYVTVGRSIGHEDCEIPTCGISWVTIAPPIVLEDWPAQPVAPHGAYTTIASWRGSLNPVVYRGKTYGLRAGQFRRFAGIPRLSDASFRIALRIHVDEGRDRALIEDNGWEVVDPDRVAGDPWRYQSFIRASRAEFMVAKTMYVDTRSGWFSDRSACYLASSRPVVAQDTGLASHYPIGVGLLTYTTLEEAAERIREVERDYQRHSRAARQVAVESFDSDKVLSGMLEDIGIGR